MVGYVADTVGAYATRKSTFRDNIRVSQAFVLSDKFRLSNLAHTCPQCFAFCVLIAISNFQYGFDTGVSESSLLFLLSISNSVL